MISSLSIPCSERLWSSFSACFLEKEEWMARPSSSRVLMTGRLAPFANAFRAELRERGYTVRTTVWELRQVARLSLWLEAQGLTAAELSDARVDEFLARPRRRSARRRSRPADWRAPRARGRPTGKAVVGARLRQVPSLLL